MNHHTLLFKHAKKFSVIGPSEIAFVHFPWSGEKLLPLDNGSKRFFSRFGEEFFYGYNASQVPAAKFNTSFKTPILTGEVAANLSIVLFLEEFTATANDPNTINVSASYLLNTTAKHSLVGSPFEQYLIAQGAFKL